MHTCFMHWMSVGHANDTLHLSLLACMSGCSFHMWISIVVTILWWLLVWSSHDLLLYSILLDHLVLASYALQVFLHTMIKLCCCVSGDTCSYDSRVSQILELGVNEFCSTVPNSHIKSRVCFRVLSQNSQKGDYKVEFNQPSCWFYSVPNLLVI